MIMKSQVQPRRRERRRQRVRARSGRLSPCSPLHCHHLHCEFDHDNHNPEDDNDFDNMAVFHIVSIRIVILIKCDDYHDDYHSYHDD